jgi:hypothetical protein
LCDLWHLVELENARIAGDTPITGSFANKDGTRAYTMNGTTVTKTIKIMDSAAAFTVAASSDVSTSQHLADEARQVEHKKNQRHEHRSSCCSSDNIGGTAEQDSFENSEDDDGVVVGESVSISKNAMPARGVLLEEDGPLSETVLPALMCHSEPDLMVTQRPRREKKHQYYQSKTKKITSTAVEFMCLPDTSSGVGGCTNPLAPSPKPYSLAMDHSSDVNARHVLRSLPKPRLSTLRSASVGSATTNARNDPNNITMHYVSTIAFNATAVAPPSLTSITTSRRPRVERFDYAKALLRSDEELEKLSQRIRKEINESELFELALAAERAANAGEEKFAGRASTFGGEQQHNHHKYQLWSTSNDLKHNNAATISTETLSTVSTTTGGSSSSVVATGKGGIEENMSLPIPTIGTTPNTPDRRVDGSLATTSSLIISPSERSLLDTLTTAATAQEPGKRSMGVDSLRDVNEVIPHWKELHEHMRTHFYRESVQQTALFFDEGSSPRKRRNDNNTTIVPLRSSTDSSRIHQHRRSRSFFESIADMTLPRFGGDGKRDSKRQIFSTRSLDRNLHTDLSDDSSHVTDSDASTTSMGRTTTLSRHISPRKDDHFRCPELRAFPTSERPPETKKTYRNSNIDSPIRLSSSFSGLTVKMEGDIATSLASKFSQGPRPLDPAGLKTNNEAKALWQLRNRSACSSEASSVVTNTREVEHDAWRNRCSEYVLPSGGNSVSGPTHLDDDYEDSGQRVSPVPLKSGMSPVSLIDDEISVSPVSPTPKFYVPISITTPPCTPRDSTVQHGVDLGFDTPTHLRVIKGMSNDVRIAKTNKIAPQQPRAENTLYTEVATTPSVNFSSLFEPNSIVDSISGCPTASNYSERMKSSLTDETRYLALPTITSSASDSSLKKLRSRGIPRRKINRTQWLDSPTTPTDPMERLFLEPMKNRHQKFLSKTTSFAEEQIPALEQILLKEPIRSFDESMLVMLDEVPNVSGKNSTIQPIPEAHSDFVRVASQNLTGQSNPSHSPPVNAKVTEYSEEKKDGEDVLLERSSPQMTISGGHVEPRTNHLDKTPFKAYSTFHDSRDDGEKTCGRSLVKTMSGLSSAVQEENSIMSQSFTTFTSAPEESCHVANGNVIPVLKRTVTWDGVVSDNPINPISAVNSFLSNTSAVVNDAASFLAEITNGDSKDIMQESTKIRDDSSSQGGHRGSYIVRSNALCHGDENIKAAVRGVLSHLSLSPRNKPPQVEESSIFLADAENKEYLQNYFYCTKRRVEYERKMESGMVANQTVMARSGGGDHVDFDNSMSRVGISCTVEPCQTQETNCHLLGVDAVCSGITYLFPKSNKYYDESSRTTGTTRTSNSCGKSNTADRDYNNHHTNDATQFGTWQHTRSASINQCKDNIESSSQHPTTVNLHDQHEIPVPYSVRLSNGRRQESWLDIFQRVATSSRKRFSFKGDNAFIPEDGISSRHPFTPPCLTRRVLTKHQT